MAVFRSAVKAVWSAVTRSPVSKISQDSMRATTIVRLDDSGSQEPEAVLGLGPRTGAIAGAQGCAQSGFRLDGASGREPAGKVAIRTENGRLPTGIDGPDSAPSLRVALAPSRV